MRIRQDPIFSIYRQVCAFKIDRKVSAEEASRALAILEHKGVELDDLEMVLGRPQSHWEQDEHRILVGFAYGIRRRHFSRRHFEAFAQDVKRATEACPGRMEPDVSPADILKLERPDSFDPEDDDGESS